MRIPRSITIISAFNFYVHKVKEINLNYKSFLSLHWADSILSTHVAGPRLPLTLSII